MKIAPLPFYLIRIPTMSRFPSVQKSEENWTRAVEQNLLQKSVLAYSGQR
jgi:hypothetical protein